MVYKKYIKRGNKLCGPYLYKSKRVGNKVISVYIGREKEPEKALEIEERNESAPGLKVLWLLIPLFFIILLLLFFFQFQFAPVGKVVLELSPSYQINETIIGDFRLNLKHGEFIPADTLVKISLGEQEKDWLLSDLIVLEQKNGSFYAENIELSGEGEGYGFVGEKKIYPEISFELEIFEVEEEIEEPEEEEQVEIEENITEVEEEPAEELENVTEEPEEEEQETEEEQKVEEEGVEEVEEEPVEEGEETEEEIQQAPITGQAVKEEEKTIKGRCSKENAFIYELEEGKTANIKKGSVKIKTTEKEKEKYEKISEDNLNLETLEGKVTITTDYEETEQGYGEQYLSEKITTLTIILEQFNITAEPGTLQIEFVYEDTVLTESSQEINVEGIEIEENITEVNITETNITINITTNITEVNITQFNITTNITIPENITEVNITIPENITEINITEEVIEMNVTEIENITANITFVNLTEVKVTVNTTQYGAQIGKPVKWKKTIKLEQAGAITIELPDFAENITVYIIRDEEVVAEEEQTEQEKIQNLTKPEQIPEEPVEEKPEIKEGKECKDSDYANDKYIKGTVTYKVGEYEDYCSGKKKLIEYYCNVLDNVETERYKCKNGCSDGACIEAEEVVACIDFDRGLDYYVARSACQDEECKDDFCIDETYLSEQYCKKSGEKASKIYKCELGCEDGKCIKPEKKEIERRKQIGGEKLILAKTIKQIERGEGITGEITAEINLEKEPKFITFFKKIFRTITGRAITTEERQDAIEVIIDENASEYEIEYETPAPIAEELRLGKGKKQLIVRGVLPYDDIKAHTFIRESEPGKVQVNGTANYKLIDNNKDGWIDEIDWQAEIEEKIEIEIIEEKEENIIERDAFSDTYDLGNRITQKIYGLVPKNVLKDGVYVPITSAIDMYASHDNVVHVDDGNTKLELKPYYYTVGEKKYMENITNENVLPHTHIYDNKAFYKYAFGVFNFSQLSAEKVGFDVSSSSEVSVNGNVLSSGNLEVDFSDIAEDYYLVLNPGYLEISGNFSDDLWLDPTVTHIINESGSTAWTEGETASLGLYGWGDCDGSGGSGDNEGEYTAAELTTASNNDTNSVANTITTSGSQDGRVCHRFKWNITEESDDISQLEFYVKHEGTITGVSYYSISFYVGNTSGTSWENLAMTTSPTSGTTYGQGGTLTSSISEYVNDSGMGMDKYVYALAFTNSTGGVAVGSQAHEVFYTELKVTHTPDTIPPNVSFTEPPTPADSSSTTNTSVDMNVSVVDSSVDEIIYNWNGTNYTLYGGDLVLMFNFNNLSALGENDSRIVDVSNRGIVGHVNGSDGFWTSAGKYGGAFELHARDDYIETTTTNPTGISGAPLTIMAWIKVESSLNQNIYQERGDCSAAAGSGFTFLINKTKLAFFTPGVKNYPVPTTATAVNDNEWHHVSVVMNSTFDVVFYIDGEQDYNVSHDTDMNAPSCYGLVGAGRRSSGYPNNITTTFNGTIDELRVWDVALTSAQINESYMSNVYKYDTDKWALDVNQSKSSGIGLDVWQNYTYYVCAKDTYGNTNCTIERTINISTAAAGDSTNPDISIVTPANNTNSSDSGLNVNFTVSDANLQACWYTNDTFVGNVTLTCGANVTGLTWIEGQHNVTVYANDTNNNENSSSITFTIDSAAPTITNIEVSADADSATITWNTNEESNSTVFYGTSVATTSMSSSSSLVTFHSLTLTGLSASTLYYYNVSSCDSVNCAFSARSSFTTEALTGGGDGEECSDTCSSGDEEPQCKNTTTTMTRTCGDYDTDSCLEWSEWLEINCITGEECKNGVCVQCVEEWQCSEWSKCFLDETSPGITGGIIDIDFTGSAITGGAITGFAISSCDNLGDRRCHPTRQGYYQECVKSRGRLRWRTRRCGSGLVCDKGECVCSEDRACENEGERRCVSESKFQVCKLNNNCLKWSRARRCAKGEVCDTGKCIIPEPEINITEPPPEINITEPPPEPPPELEEGQIKLAEGETTDIIINRGDRISVAYDMKTGNSGILTIGRIETSFSSDVQETHKIILEHIQEDKVRVRVESPSVSKDVGLGETVFFDLYVMIQTRTCVDINNCGTEQEKPIEMRVCGEEELLAYGACISKWNISEWSECMADYSLKELIEKENKLQGVQERLWQDLRECREPRTETRVCNLTMEIKAEKVRWCEEDYVEVREKDTNQLVSRVKETTLEKVKRVKIGFLISNFTGYCEYCYDGMKNYDELGIDCGGENCPECVEYRFDYWLLFKILLWLLLLLLILIYIIYIYSRRKNRKKRLLGRIQKAERRKYMR